MISQEYGKRLTLATGFDLSGALSLRIWVRRPGGVEVSYAGEMGVVDAEVVDSRGVTYRLKANEYMYRDWADGDIDVPGRYRVRAVYEDGGKRLRSPQVVLEVRP